MEHERQDEIEDLSFSPQTMVSLQIAGSCGGGHNAEFMTRAYSRNVSSEIDMDGEVSFTRRDRPLPVFLKAIQLFIFNTLHSFSLLKNN